MTRTHAARQLLALGPLSFSEFAEVTGWPRAVCRRVLTYLVDALGQVRRADGLYWIANANQLPDVHPLEAAREQGNGAQPLRPLRPWPGVEVPPATADMRETQAGICGRCRGAQELGGEVLNREITGPSGSGA